MMSLDPRSSDRTSYYTMKTPGLPSPGPSHAHSLSNPPTFLATKSSTPMASPSLPYSVGQAYPPKLSPSAGRGLSRAPSPNYFGIAVEPAAETCESTAIPHENWSPPSSSLKPFAAALPTQLPLDANPEFEAFRRQVDVNRGRAAFNLSNSNFVSFGGNVATPGMPPTSAPLAPPAIMRPRFSRWHTHGSDVSEGSLRRVSSLPASAAQTSAASILASKMDIDTNSLPDSAYVSFDSKRSSELLMDPPQSILGTTQFESPAQMDSPFTVPERRRSNMSIPPERHSSSSFSVGNPCPPTRGSPNQGAEKTVPRKEESESPSMIAPSQLHHLIECAPDSEILVLDVRVSPQYAQSRIRGALNLCIPTTLLKRATFNLQKLQQTFQGAATQDKFANWRNTTHLIVYDASSPEKRDAVSATNMLKKFSNEGYKGSMNILRGGFNAFAAAYPDLVDSSSTVAPASFSLGANPGPNGGPPSLAPVIGGVMLPNAVNKANPFFSNIRQNQDLVDGVGQMDINVPAGLDLEMLPKWLRDAADKMDHGKRTSDKFLQIELDEKTRMMDAYSAFNLTTSATKVPEVQLCGVEKGDKNRYKDILPFEHARVRLEGRTGCDYVNASHLKASRSHKRYIATQGPLPATFEDFWSVIWDQDVRVIVMLTAESEGGQLKCHPYWTDKEFGQIKLRSLSEKKVSLEMDKPRSHSAACPNLNTPSPHPNTPSSHSSQHSFFSWNTSQAEIGRRRANTTTTLEAGAPTPAQPNLGSAAETPYVIIRKFALSHAAHPFSPIREITHLHYPSWPDFGAPAEPSHLLALVELANVMQRSTLPIEVPGLIPTSREAKADHSNGCMGGRRGSINGGWNGGDGSSIQWHDMPEPSNSKTDGHGSRPMLVHCSAGCGRTGAFCTIDSVLDMLKRQRVRAARRSNKARTKGRKTGKLAGVNSEGEKRIAADQQLVGEHLREKRRALGKGSDDGDGIGDVAMVAPPDVADDDAVSPLATFKEPANHHLVDWPEVVRTMAGTNDDDDGGSSSNQDDDEDGEGIDTTWLDDETVDLVAHTVADFRRQRLSMVQSLRQFVLCYETVLEWVSRVQQQQQGGLTAKGRARSGSLAM